MRGRRCAPVARTGGVEPQRVAARANDVVRVAPPHVADAIAQAALGDPDPAVRKAALGTLATLGHPFVPHLMRSALKDPDKETRETAKTLLETVGDVGRESAQVDAPQGVPPAPVVPASASTTPRH